MAHKPGDLGGSTRTKTYLTTADFKDVDALKTSVATSTSVATYSGGALNGAIGTATMDPPRGVSITTASHSGSYNTGAAIVVTGTYGGQVVSESISLTQANGGETVYGSQPFDAVTSIAVPAQTDALGSFQFGVGDIWAKDGQVWRGVKANGGDGTIGLRFDAGYSDSLPAKENTFEVVVYRAVIASTTSVGVTLYS